MTAMLGTFSPEDRMALLGEIGATEDVDWPTALAREAGWRAANVEYQRRQREAGRREMRALMASAGVAPGMDAERAFEVVAEATRTFLQTDATRAVTRIRDGELRLYTTRCPLYVRFLDHGWGGLTACGCFARRQGWFDAIGAGLEEELVMNRKWGDPACQTVVRVKARAA